jgi:hypothetical protein
MPGIQHCRAILREGCRHPKEPDFIWAEWHPDSMPDGCRFTTNVPYNGLQNKYSCVNIRRFPAPVLHVYFRCTISFFARRKPRYLLIHFHVEEQNQWWGSKDLGIRNFDPFAHPEVKAPAIAGVTAMISWQNLRQVGREFIKSTPRTESDTPQC